MKSQRKRSFEMVMRTRFARGSEMCLRLQRETEKGKGKGMTLRSNLELQMLWGPV